ncbi:DUF6950 family protein [Oxalicibacterium faecigallinarum]|uniref:DUF6950 domain-containing protein n=1 Tax=Oxalicibacterium faecigallinarum TaxID=573741 RepID=A0A8J3AUN4_9BURK|nr:hypothetical protein [Oxalicibacterium faecigallinarum]GGI16458.1 hypothetical protein GCM10008066_04060 [Oxalicibacterium faecigallinarum]
MSLADYIKAHLCTPFKWGEHDCVLFAARWALLATGTDHLAGVSPWRDARAAMRMVRRMGGMQALMDARLARVHVNLARDGDIALYRRCLCIVSGAHLVGPNHHGLEFIKRTEAECAWSLHS